MSSEAKETLNREYHKLQHRWVEELDKPETNWENLFFLHFELAVLESRVPGLKKDGQA